MAKNETKTYQLSADAKIHRSYELAARGLQPHVFNQLEKLVQTVWTDAREYEQEQNFQPSMLPISDYSEDLGHS